MKKLITFLSLIICIYANAQQDILNEYEKLQQAQTELFKKLFTNTYDYTDAIAAINSKVATQQTEIDALKLQLEKVDVLELELADIKQRLTALENGSTDNTDDGTDNGNDDGTSPPVSNELKAFPTAEGYGKYAVGGRGGRIIKVTNLNDSGAGSFREACEASGKRIVVFEVGGRIDVTGPTIKIKDPYITIAGQTAVGGGIMLTRETRDRPILEIDADEVIIRYIRFRRSQQYQSGNNQDNVWVNSGNNIIFDHCSLSWSSDGNLDLANYDGQPGRPTQIEISNVTIQYCILTNSYGGSNKTMLVSRGATNISWFRNAWLSTASRNPSVSTPVNEAPTWDCYYEHINNFHYDFTNGASYNNNDPSSDAGIYYVNVIKNHAKENGNPSPTVENTIVKSRRWLRATTVGNDMKIYVEGNITPYRPNETYDEWEIGQNGGGQADRDRLIPENLRTYTINDTQIINDGVELWGALDIWDNLKDSVGASLPKRDVEDARAVNDVNLGISTENKVNNVFPTIENGTPRTDNDNDGLPDDWELSQFGNLNKTSSSLVGDKGYTAMCYLLADDDYFRTNQ